MVHKFHWKKFPPDVRRQVTACGLDLLHATDTIGHFIWTRVTCPACRANYRGRTLGIKKQEKPDVEV